ncbi:MAG: hypothetical protein KJ077_43130 [Anaerolineae bacterium]|nr:hypothetical protein [Anaerolineae bacterium]
MQTKTQLKTPPMRSSDEATQEQLRLAKEQGNAFQKAVEHMTQKEAHGAEKQVADYLIGYAVEHAEGMIPSPRWATQVGKPPSGRKCPR